MKKKDYILGLLLILCCLFYAETNAQETYSKVSILPVTQNLIDRLVDLGMTIDHAEYLPDGSISFYVTQDELQALEQENINFRIDIEDYGDYYLEQTAQDAEKLENMERGNGVANGFDLGSMGGFYTWAEVGSKLDEMKQDYPNLITAKTSIGTSIEGREIWMVKISDNPDINEEEPVAYFDAVHHAREPLSMATTINYMFWLLENYETDEQVRFLVDNRELYFVPVVNPDGYEYNRAINPDGGGLWRKNRNPNDGNCVGVDLNRNYSFGYGLNNDCSSPNQCSGVYRGEGPFSEPETAAVRDFLALVSPKTAFSTHSTAGSYLMPYGFDTSPPQFDIYSEWASVFLSENNYPYGVTFQMLGYTSCGTTRDFMHSEGIYGWTPEIDGEGFWPPQSTIFDLVGENVYPLFYQSWISGAFVDIQSHRLTGDAIPGESFSLEVEAKNVGVGAIAENVTVSVSTTAPGVTVSPPLNYGSIGIRDRVGNESNPFIITLDSGFEEVLFHLKISTFQEGVLNDVLEIPVYVGEKEVLFFDDGSNGPAHWTATGNGIHWSEVTDDAYSDTVCFGDSNGGNGMNNTLNYFELNADFDLSEATTLIVSFMEKHSLEDGDFAAFQATSGEGHWETLANFTQSERWSPVTVNLQNYVGEPAIRFRFLMSTDGIIPADGFYFDDFEISNYTDKILSEDDITFGNEFTLYPNPFSHSITVSHIGSGWTEQIELALYDLHGRKMDAILTELDNSRTISNLDKVSAGIYFLKISDKNRILYIYKVIKQE